MCFVYCFDILSRKSVINYVLISQVHHGGAGTTAAGLKAAVMPCCKYFFFLKLDYTYKLTTFFCLSSQLQCPTTIVPFFGDQPFWGEQVHARGVGPPPIPIDEFSLPKLVDSINYMLDPLVRLLKTSDRYAWHVNWHGIIVFFVLSVEQFFFYIILLKLDQWQVKERAVELAKAMEKEDGVTGAVKAFLKQLHIPCRKPEPETERSTSSFLSISRCFGCS